MTSIIIGGYSHESQAYLTLFFQEKTEKIIARGTGSSIGGSSPTFHQSGLHLNQGTGSSIGGS